MSKKILMVMIQTGAGISRFGLVILPTLFSRRFLTVRQDGFPPAPQNHAAQAPGYQASASPHAVFSIVIHPSGNQRGHNRLSKGRRHPWK